jgi:serine/threonine protein kinase
MREKGDAQTCPHCHVTHLTSGAPHHLVPGSTIGRRYVVGKVLGEGGFGITYIGLDNILRIPVAVKEYFPHGWSHRDNATSRVIPSSSSGSVAFFQKGKDRFLLEARSMARFFREPGIVDVRDFFEENNTAYIVMEYLDGVDLRHYLRQNGVMAPEQAFDMLRPAMLTLEKIHKAGLIHRDISPDNIMYLTDGSLKLMDFGAARDFEDENRSMSVMLKPGYAPEEQYRKKGEQGPWTDVYALCATLYRCITGKTPTEATDRTYEDDLMRPSKLGVAISPALENVLMYGLAVRKADRCQSMTELLSMIDEAMKPQPPEPEPVAQPEPQYAPPQYEPQYAQPPVYAPVEPVPDDPYSAFRQEKLSDSFNGFFDKISDRFVVETNSPAEREYLPDDSDNMLINPDADPYRALRGSKKQKKHKPAGDNPYLQAIYGESAQPAYPDNNDTPDDSRKDSTN